MRKIIIVILILIIALQSNAEDNPTEKVYTPKITGSIRGKYEYNSSLQGHRFQVRNARFSVRGQVSPYALYKAEIDLSDEGVTKMLDAYVEMLPTKALSFTIGQQKVPFSTDNLRSPHNLYFANRSFINKQLTGIRDVGATIQYSLDDIMPVDLIAGVYNGKGLYNQQEWRTDLSYVTRFLYRPSDNINAFFNYNTLQPYQLRMYMYNGGIFYKLNNWYVESEVFYKTYQDDLFSSTYGFFVFLSYDIKMPKWEFMEDISPRLRYDTMTDDNNGRINAITNTYTVDDVARSRITAGLNFNFRKPFINEIRFNYEHYFYNNGIVNADNKWVVEFVTKF